MSQHFRSGGWLIALLLVVAVPIAWQMSSSRVEVVVVGASGPLADASVELRPVDQGDVSKAKTDSRGRAVVEVWPGTYRVHAEAPGYTAGELGPLEVAWLKERKERMVLAPRMGISGPRP